MNFITEHRDNIVVLAVKHKKLDATVSSGFKAELLIICQPDIEALIIDMSTVEIIESSGLGCLLLAHRQLNEYAIPIILIGVHKMVRSMLNISQIDGLFEYYDGVEDAIEELQSGQEYEI